MSDDRLPPLGHLIEHTRRSGETVVLEHRVLGDDKPDFDVYLVDAVGEILWSKLFDENEADKALKEYIVLLIE